MLQGPRTSLPSLIAIATTLFLSSLANAQSQGERPAPSPPPARPILLGSSTMRVELPAPMPEMPVPMLGGSHPEIDTLSFITPDATFERVLIKGAPFSADSATEHYQTLADGNRLGRKSTARIYRDASGRTRREHDLGANTIAPDGQPPRQIIINDPIGRVNYLLDTRTGIAQKMVLPPAEVWAAMRPTLGTNAPFSVLIPTGVVHRRMAEGDSAPPPPKPERTKLPAQSIEGVTATGTRTTITIPAGMFDNEQPLVITHEEWYSPELQMIVLMKHNDPRFGETTFRLTNILRGEPATELFELPAGYKVEDRVRRLGGEGGPPMIKRP